jgi:hypothetical protein
MPNRGPTTAPPPVATAARAPCILLNAIFILCARYRPPMRAYLDIHPVTPLVCATLSFLLHYIIAAICDAGTTFLARLNVRL